LFTLMMTPADAQPRLISSIATAYLAPRRHVTRRLLRAEEARCTPLARTRCCRGRRRRI